MGPLVGAPAIAAPAAGGAAAGGAGLTMAQGIGAGLSATGMGMQIGRSRKAYKRSRSMMNKSFRQQQQLMQHGHNLNYDMWLKTNYPAQVEMMKQAGLNPALMYGSAGAAGSTGKQSGSASAGHGPQITPIDMSPMLMGAEIENLLANAKLTREKAENEAGVVRDNAQADYDTKMLELEISGDTKEYQKREIRDRAVGIAVQNALNRSGIRLNNQRMRNLENEIYQKWASVGFQGLDAITGIVFKYKGLVNEVSSGRMAMPNPNTVWQQSSAY